MMWLAGQEEAGESSEGMWCDRKFIQWKSVGEEAGKKESGIMRKMERIMGDHLN
jgi:hypothetical protein